MHDDERYRQKGYGVIRLSVDAQDLDRSALCLKIETLCPNNTFLRQRLKPSGKYMMYRHDQIGWLMVIVVGVAAIITGVLWHLHGETINAVGCIILFLLIPFFYRLQVIADDAGAEG